MPKFLASAAAAPAVLQLQNLNLSFGGVRVSNGVDLALAPDEVVAIIGPNGAGKSALLNCIGGIYRPAAGSRILLDGRRIDALASHHAGEFARRDGQRNVGGHHAAVLAAALEAVREAAGFQCGGHHLILHRGAGTDADAAHDGAVHFHRQATADDGEPPAIGDMDAEGGLARLAELIIDVGAVARRRGGEGLSMAMQMELILLPSMRLKAIRLPDSPATAMHMGMPGRSEESTAPCTRMTASASDRRLISSMGRLTARKDRGGEIAVQGVEAADRLAEWIAAGKPVL